MNYTREIYSELKEHLFQKRTTVIVGMRQVGKTTILKSLYEDTPGTNKIILDMENLLIRKIFSEDNYDNIVLSLIQQGLNLDQKAYIFLDEIQLVSNLPSIIKYIYDKYNVKFVVTGSSSYYLKNLFSESMAGRKQIFEIFPLTFSEFLGFKEVVYTRKHTFSEAADSKLRLSVDLYNDLFAEYIEFGGFPEVVLTSEKKNKQSILEDIINSYFLKDVAVLADFKESGELRDLLLLLTQRIGQKLDISNLGSILGLSREKVYSHLEFLQSTYVIGTVSQKSSIDNQIRSGSKLYFTDTGLAKFLGSIDFGSSLENSIFMNIRNLGDITYFQTGSGNEIDFVIDRNIGLEVKTTPSLLDIRNLNYRLKSAKLNEGYIVGYNFFDHEQVVMSWDLPKTHTS